MNEHVHKDDAEVLAERAFRGLVNGMSTEKFNAALKEAPPHIALKMVAVRTGCV